METLVNNKKEGTTVTKNLARLLKRKFDFEKAPTLTMEEIFKMVKIPSDAADGRIIYAISKGEHIYCAKVYYKSGIFLVSVATTQIW